MWPLKTILYFAFFWVACLMALVNPIWGVVNYMFAYQIHPKNTWWGAPLAAMGMRFSMLAAVFTMLGLILGRKHVPQIKPSFCPWEVGIVALVAAAALNLVIGFDYTPTSRYAFEKLWKMLLFVLILGRLATTRRNLRLVLWTLVAGSLYLGYDAYTAPKDSFLLGRLEYIGGPDFSTTSGAAAHLTAMLPLAATAFLIARNWWWRFFAAASAVLTFNAIILCRTRSAFLGLVCGALAAALMTPRARRYRIYLLLLTGGALALSLTDQHFWTRMSTLTDEQMLRTDSATVCRAEIWAASRKILSDYPQGVGPGNFRNVIGSYDPRHWGRATHNTLIVCFTELGVHGGIIFLLLTAGALRMLHISSRIAGRTDNPVETELMAYGFLVSCVTYFVTGLGTERFYCESYWWVWVLPLCLHRVVMREVTADANVPALKQRWKANEEHAPLGQLQHEL